MEVAAAGLPGPLGADAAPTSHQDPSGLIGGVFVSSAEGTASRWVHLPRLLSSSAGQTAASAAASWASSSVNWCQVVTTAAAVVFLLFWVGLRLLHILAVIYGKWRLHKKPELSGVSAGDTPPPGVSILKPLCASGDPNLFTNLETFFTLEYPKYELLICIQDPKDFQLREYIAKLRKKYPLVDVQVFYGGEKVGVNPKINNLSPGYKASKYDLILVSDDRIKMKHDALSDMVSFMTPNVGLVHQMPFTCDRTDVQGSMMEKVYFGTSFARFYLVSTVLGINCMVGMSFLVRKPILEAAGGLKEFGRYLAEDFFIAKSVLDSGMDMQISSQPALQNSGDGGVLLFQNRLTRWTKLRNAMLPHLIFVQPLSDCIILGLASAWAVLYLFSWDPLAFFFIHLLVWYLMDWILLLVIQNGCLPFNKFEFLIVWLFHEIQTPYVYLMSHLNPNIEWRTNSFRLKWGGLAEPVKSFHPLTSSQHLPITHKCQPSAYHYDSTVEVRKPAKA